MEENENGDFYPELKLILENEDEYDIKVEVPPNNEILNNKLIENNGTITVSSLMTTPNTKNGITKDSTLQVNVNPYLPNNYQQTLNYVGYWKWDSINQTFIQVLNSQDISEGKYNLRIQPLFYDADTGLPQKVTVSSGNTKRLKMVNDNNDGALEPTEYVENNTMVKFNSRTRSVTEYPYFEVEALPPTITSPVTSNGYYKFDGNTLIHGTDQDYNIYINIEAPIPEYDITKFVFGSYGNSSIPNTFSNSNNITKQTGNYTGSCCFIKEKNNTIIISFGIPPNGSYYCNNNTFPSNNKVTYDNEILSYGYICENDNRTLCYNTVTLFGKLINLPDNNK